MKARAATFATEVALCSAFTAAVDERAWVLYPETAGWDILLVRRADGFQIGIHAKLRLNVDVISQAIDEYGHWSAAKPGPDCRAVLVPPGGMAGFHRICAYLALVIITVTPGQVYGSRFHPALPTQGGDNNGWPEWAPADRHALPEYVPDVPAGAPAPLRLTEWKIKAMKLAVILEQRPVRRTDFKHLQLDHRRWVEGGWLSVKDGGFVVGPRWPDFKGQHPLVYEQIKADAKRWMPKPLKPPKDLLR